MNWVNLMLLRNHGLSEKGAEIGQPRNAQEILYRSLVSDMSLSDFHFSHHIYWLVICRPPQ